MDLCTERKIQLINERRYLPNYRIKSLASGHLTFVRLVQQSIDLTQTEPDLIAQTEFLPTVFNVVTAFGDHIGLVRNYIHVFIQILFYKSAF